MNKHSKITTHAWLILAASALFLLYKYILQLSPSVITSELMRYFHIDATELGNLSATFSYSYLIMQLLAGPLIDRLGSRLCTSSAIMLCALGSVIFSMATSLFQAELGRVLMGAGAAFATISYLKVVSIWFPEERFALFSGLLTIAVMIGALAGQAPLAYATSKIGWHQSLFYCAILGASIAIVYYLFTSAEGSLKHGSEASRNVSLRSLISLLRSKHNVYLTLYSGLAFSPLIVFGGLWGVPFLQESYELSKTVAASYTSLLFVGFAIGGPLLGFLSDRYQKRTSFMMVGVLITLISCCLILYFPPVPHGILILQLLFFGIGTGGIMLGFVMGKDLNSIILAASVVGLINTGDATFGSLTEPLVGKLLDNFWQGKIFHGIHYYSVADYRIALSILPIYLLLAMFFINLLRRKDTIIKQYLP